MPQAWEHRHFVVYKWETGAVGEAHRQKRQALAPPCVMDRQAGRWRERAPWAHVSGMWPLDTRMFRKRRHLAASNRGVNDDRNIRIDRTGGATLTHNNVSHT